MVRAGAVGEAFNVPEEGQYGHSPIVSVDSLPECDVLELNCEGVGLQILEELSLRPQTIIVEGHGCHGASESELRELLSEMDYEVIDRNPQDKDREIDILTAVQE